MKKLTIIIVLILGMTMTTFADGGLFQRGNNTKYGSSGYSLFGSKLGGDYEDTGIYPLLPIHDLDDDQPAAPLGSGIAVLMSLGAAYMVAKKRREE
jgi:hypothetical protein